MHRRPRRGIRILTIALAGLALGCGKYGPPTRANASAAAPGSVSASATAAEDCEDDEAAASPAQPAAPEAQP